MRTMIRDKLFLVLSQMILYLSPFHYVNKAKHLLLAELSWGPGEGVCGNPKSLEFTFLG